jgi:hypothetical protein
MSYFNLRKEHPEPEPEPEAVEEEPPEETEDEPEDEPAEHGPILTGLLGPGTWIAAHFGTGTAWGVHVVAVWAVGFYGGWTAAGILLGWLAAVLLFVPKECLDGAAAWIERRINPPQDDSEEPAEPAGEPLVGPDPQDVIDLVRDVIGDDRGALLTALRQPLRAPDTKAVREVLATAGMRVRPGVRTGAGNGPGVHRDDLPPLSPADEAPDGERCLPRSTANNNTNSALRVQSREGMTIINDPADRHRTHSLKKP